ncbi:hypothetical protein OIU76_027935 [Salix suchowensis]|nr:hypothetical protein OIU76_027935 [Salix suchowensis]
MTRRSWSCNGEIKINIRGARSSNLRRHRRFIIIFKTTGCVRNPITVII